MSVESISPAELDDVLQRADCPVVVDFWMDDCPPCNMMAPKLEVVAREHEDQVATYRAHVDEDDPLLRTCDIEAMPAILFFRDGELADRIEGLVSADELREAFGDLTSST